MARRKFTLGQLAAVAAILAIPLIAACGGGSDAPVTLTIPVVIQLEGNEPETIAVKQGDMVTLQIQSEAAGEFHLHGYDVKTQAKAGGSTDLYFLADATGRFRITFHESEAPEEAGEESEHGEESGEKGHDDDGDDDAEDAEIELGFLEVHPR